MCERNSKDDDAVSRGERRAAEDEVGWAAGDLARAGPRTHSENSGDLLEGSSRRAA